MESPSQEKPFKIVQNLDFKAAFEAYLTEKAKRLDEVLGSPNEHLERQQYVVLLCNFALYARLFRRSEPKLYKNIWALQKKAPVIQIVGHITFRSESFLKLNCGSDDGQKLDPKDMRQYRLDYLRSLDSSYEERINTLYLKVSDWCSLINSPQYADLATTKSAMESTNGMAKTIIEGISLASQVKLLTDDLLLLHYTEHVDMKPGLLMPIMKALCMIKGIDFELNSKITPLSIVMPLLKRLVQNQLSVVWEDCRNAVEKQAKSVPLTHPKCRTGATSCALPSPPPQTVPSCLSPP
ncbi:MAG: hypothetical protein P4M11_08840 [Candidatus Pacebacteria bacterium]|nr:hypothetical protein [Candidatus Paceibacterota bacterium]